MRGAGALTGVTGAQRRGGSAEANATHLALTSSCGLTALTNCVNAGGSSAPAGSPHAVAVPSPRQPGSPGGEAPTGTAAVVCKGSLLGLVQRPEQVCRRIGTLRPGRSSLPLLGAGAGGAGIGVPASSSRPRRLLPALIRRRIIAAAELRCRNPSPLRWRGRGPAGNPAVGVVDLELVVRAGAQWDVTEL